MNSSAKDKDKGKEAFRHESLQDRQSIVAYLEALTEGFREGTLSFASDAGGITLNPEGLIQFELSASRKRDQMRLSLKFSWKDDDETERPGELRISADG